MERIAIVVDLRRRRLAPIPVAVLYSAGLTAVLAGGRDAPAVEVPWSNVAGAFAAVRGSKGRLLFLQMAVRDRDLFFRRHSAGVPAHPPWRSRPP
jgi:hypothetical protein